MERPEVKKGGWIILRESAEDPGIEAQIYREQEDGTLFVGYHAYSIRTTKAHAVWDETFWRVAQRRK
ncbi:MAG: hypothetical protein COA46_01150 [Porticoccaceae bacterium]|nr:MAG: hypothetical protein COA46_01150 [Porticoccaceae bacterium]